MKKIGIVAVILVSCFLGYKYFQQKVSEAIVKKVVDAQTQFAIRAIGSKARTALKRIHDAEEDFKKTNGYYTTDLSSLGIPTAELSDGGYLIGFSTPSVDPKNKSKPNMLSSFELGILNLEVQ